MTDSPHDTFAYWRRHINRTEPIVPKYRVTTVTHDGLPYCREETFTAAHSSTAAPFPECATLVNCRRLIEMWNRASAGHSAYTLT
ncbi:hypothetical protein ACNRDG_06505 [Ralstonia pseudosolanacearum]|uniref:hypothetical protein n=1 Tax=Ralstonia pseudosolanacearum TaxID=1310165 RepID=UPI003AAEF66B